MSNLQQMKENQLSNRRYITKKKLMITFAILFILSLCIKTFMDTNMFKVNKVQFHSGKIPESSAISILQISDVHNKVFGDNNEKLMKTIEKLNADIIVITGDLVDRSTDNLKHMFSLIDKITSIHKHVFFVTGNHEWDNPKREELLAGLKERKVTVLNNKNSQLTVDGVTLNLVGIDDASTNHENVNEAFNGINDKRYTVLLSHTPDIIENDSEVSADLILSGHTHGGQVRLPFIGALVAPDQGFFPKFEKGTYKIDNSQYLYIDSGLGTSVAPIRFMNQSQISYIKISNPER
ncbi:MAG: metallophosphoesterase [Virgibacillus proomii]